MGLAVLQPPSGLTTRRQQRAQIRQRVGKRLTKLREARGLMPAELAKAVGVRPTTIASYEMGLSDITLTRACKLSRALRCDVLDLLSS
jgi:transcriptional regulator with XRE-family HTH domain